MATTLMNEDEIKSMGSVNQETQNAILMADRNKWFLVSVMLIVVSIILAFTTFYFAQKAGKNVELVYLKLYRDGTWQVTPERPGDERPLSPVLLSNMFAEYLKDRYGQMPETMTQNYAEAMQFMSPSMQADFTRPEAEGGYGAVEKAEAVLASGGKANRVDIEFKFANNYDVISSNVNGVAGQIYRSNLHFTRIERGFDGFEMPNGRQELILKAEWTLVPESELKNRNLSELIINPLGIQFIKTDLIKDPSVQPTAFEG